MAPAVAAKADLTQKGGLRSVLLHCRTETSVGLGKSLKGLLVLSEVKGEGSDPQVDLLSPTDPRSVLPFPWLPRPFVPSVGSNHGGGGSEVTDG